MRVFLRGGEVILGVMDGFRACTCSIGDGFPKGNGPSDKRQFTMSCCFRSAATSRDLRAQWTSVDDFVLALREC